MNDAGQHKEKAMSGRESDFIRWWHDRGYNTRIMSVDTEKREIMIGTTFDGMRLSISRPDPLGVWIVECQVPQTEVPDDQNEIMIVRRTYTHNEIRCAFGLESKVKAPRFGDIDRQMCEKYRADVGVSGKFIRQGNKLNIPWHNNNFWNRMAMSILITRDMQRLFMDLSSPDDAKILGQKWPSA
jgi:hypothetical protein